MSVCGTSNSRSRLMTGIFIDEKDSSDAKEQIQCDEIIENQIDSNIRSILITGKDIDQIN